MGTQTFSAATPVTAEVAKNEWIEKEIQQHQGPTVAQATALTVRVLLNQMARNWLATASSYTATPGAVARVEQFATELESTVGQIVATKATPISEELRQKASSVTDATRLCSVEICGAVRAVMETLKVLSRL